MIGGVVGHAGGPLERSGHAGPPGVAPLVYREKLGRVDRVVSEGDPSEVAVYADPVVARVLVPVGLVPDDIGGGLTVAPIDGVGAGMAPDGDGYPLVGLDGPPGRGKGFCGRGAHRDGYLPGGLPARSVVHGHVERMEAGLPGGRGPGQQPGGMVDGGALRHAAGQVEGQVVGR